MGSAFDDRTPLHDKDPAGIADGRQAVRDDEARPVGGQRLHPVLDEHMVLLSPLVLLFVNVLVLVISVNATATAPMMVIDRV